MRINDGRILCGKGLPLEASMKERVDEESTSSRAVSDKEGSVLVLVNVWRLDRKLLQLRLRAQGLDEIEKDVMRRGMLLCDGGEVAKGTESEVCAEFEVRVRGAGKGAEFGKSGAAVSDIGEEGVVVGGFDAVLEDDGVYVVVRMGVSRIFAWLLTFSG